MKKIILIMIIITLLLATLTGCEKRNTKNPVTLTLWHNYGGQLKQTMDDMIPY